MRTIKQAVLKETKGKLSSKMSVFEKLSFFLSDKERDTKRKALRMTRFELKCAKSENSFSKVKFKDSIYAIKFLEDMAAIERQFNGNVKALVRLHGKVASFERMKAAIERTVLARAESWELTKEDKDFLWRHRDMLK